MKILRVTPEYFDVLYQINPHMKIGSVDKTKARLQWKKIGDVYRQIGAELFEIPGQAGLPDMVFSANQSLPFSKPNGQKAVLLSNMANPQREKELPFFEDWFATQGYEILKLPKNFIFEGMGDLLLSYDRSFVWGGAGPRSTVESHRAIENLIAKPVRTLQLVDPNFYHLDTCLAILDQKSAVAYRAAFSQDAWVQILEEYPNLIEVTDEEANSFVCNLHCPDGKHVLIPEGSPRIIKILKEKSFTVIPVDTSEFLKSGGSVFCMKLDLE